MKEQLLELVKDAIDSGVKLGLKPGFKFKSKENKEKAKLIALQHLTAKTKLVANSICNETNQFDKLIDPDYVLHPMGYRIYAKDAIKINNGRAIEYRFTNDVHHVIATYWIGGIQFYHPDTEELLGNCKVTFTQLINNTEK